MVCLDFAAARKLLPAAHLFQLGYWRLLDPDYQESTLKYLLVSAVAEDMSFDQLLLSECISVMDTDTPEEIVKHMLKGFSESCEDTRNGKNERH